MEGGRTLAAAGMTSMPDIRSLIQQKERELHDINEYRIAALETVVSQRDDELNDLRAKLVQIKDDFSFNLSLIKERDAELEAYDAAAAKSRQVEAALAAELDSARLQLSHARASSEADRVKLAEMEAWYKHQIALMRDSVEAARVSRGEELNSWREQLQSVRADAAARVRAAEAEGEEARAKIRDAAEAALLAAQREARKREDEASAAIRSADERAAAAAAQAGEATKEANVLRAALEAARSAARHGEAEASAANAQLNATTVEYETSLVAVSRERDAAVSSRAQLLDEYERRMGGLITSLRGAEGAFREQKAEYEARLAETAARVAADTAEKLSAASTREATLLARVHEVEAAARLAGLGLGEARGRAEGAEQRADKAERAGLEKDRELASMREQLSSLSSRTSSQLAAAHARIHEAIETGASGEGVAARVRADLVAALTRAEQAESQMRNVDHVWEQRWAAREGELRRDHSAELTSLLQHRDALVRQLAAASTPHHVAGDSRKFDTSIDKDGSVDDSARALGTDAAPVLRALSDMEGELRAARAEGAEARARLDALTARGHGEDDLDSTAYATLHVELASAQARVLALEDSEGRLRGVVADMRAHMEELQEEYREAQALLERERQAARAVGSGRVSAVVHNPPPDAVSLSPSVDVRTAEALAYRASAEGLLASMRKERDGLAADLQRSHAYVSLLQSRSSSGPLAGHESGGRESAEGQEVSLLRAHLGRAQEETAALRAQVRECEAQLAVVRGTQELAAHRGGGPAAQDAEREAADLHTRVEELVKERDALIELSNSLRAQVHRLQASSTASARRGGQEQASSTLSADRAAFLEQALGRVTAQNDALKADMQRLISRVERQAVTKPQRDEPQRDEGATAGADAPVRATGAASTAAAPVVAAPALAPPRPPVQTTAPAADAPAAARASTAAERPGVGATPWEAGVVGLGLDSRVPSLHSAASRADRGYTKAGGGGGGTKGGSGRRASSASSTEGAEPRRRPSGASTGVPALLVSSGVRQLAEAKASAAGRLAPGGSGAPAWLKTGP